MGLGFLDQSLCDELREVISSSPIFYEDPQYLTQYNLCCAVMDRLDICIRKLNGYGEYPDKEEDFLIFMMFSCMIVDAVKEILCEMGEHVKSTPTFGNEDDYKFFKEIYLQSPVYNPEKDIPNDDKFFEYLRSLIFAHPFETSRPKFLKKDEKQYSPWVIVNRSVVSSFEQDLVGVRIYTNQTDKIIDLLLPFAILKDYIRSRYERIRLATKWAQKQIELSVIEYKKTKVNRNQKPIDILIEIKHILSSRYICCYSCEEVIEYLKCDLTVEENRSSVEKFRNAIISEIPEICDAVDALDNELTESIFSELFAKPANMHKLADYQLEKILVSSDEQWASIQARAFADQFAKKWVKINGAMPRAEVKLLVRTACYLERQDQKMAK